MRALVTGAAGFIGGHLTRSLLQDGVDVVGIDSVTNYYDKSMKHRNLRELSSYNNFEHLDLDLASREVPMSSAGFDVVFHLAGQPGVRASWGDFRSYVAANVEATQRILEWSIGAARTPRFVYASSSSVYGDLSSYPTNEDKLPAPHSPYGVTKLAGEHLVNLYARNYGLGTVALRFFTVYGPGQRPDMAFHRIINAALSGDTFVMNGDGSQVRDFTFVGDIVRGLRLAGESSLPTAQVMNLAGGSSTSLLDAVRIVEKLLGMDVPMIEVPSQRGDVRATGGNIARAERLLGWRPMADLETGLCAQVDWHRNLLGAVLR